jgi:hypothetical protein
MRTAAVIMIRGFARAKFKIFLYFICTSHLPYLPAIHMYV